MKGKYTAEPLRNSLIKPRGRPKTGPARISKHRREFSGKSDATTHDGHEIELLEYEWPDLPPIPSVKEAITRQRVSRGISYLLPVDKGRNAINHLYRTDLRAMFQEPYASAGTDFDDAREGLSAKVHFRSNTLDNVWTRNHVDNLTITLNSESERHRKLYSQSAPSGDAARRMGIDSSNLRTRSGLFLPVKPKVQPEAVKMRREAEKLAKSVQEDKDDEFEEQMQKDSTDDESNKSQTSNRASVLLERRRSQRRSTIIPTKTSYRLETFESYKDFKESLATKQVIPRSLRSPFLSDEQNQYIWEWLHSGDEISDFQYFLAMCG